MTLALATFIFVLVPAVVISGVCIQALSRITVARPHPVVPSDWSPELSIDRYRPMFRLLDEGDIRFLQSQPGATPGLIKRLRRQRYLIFRGYLESLRRDFQRACDVLMLVAVESRVDRRDIVRTLLVSRLRFTFALLRVHYRLSLYRWKLASVPARQLVELFEALQLELMALRPSAASVQA